MILQAVLYSSSIVLVGHFCTSDGDFLNCVLLLWIAFLDGCTRPPNFACCMKSFKAFIAAFLFFAVLLTGLAQQSIVSRLSLASFTSFSPSVFDDSLYWDYVVIPGRPTFSRAYDSRYMCRLKNRDKLPDHFRHILQGRPIVSTNMNVAIVGDSVGVQFGGVVQRVAGEGGRGRQKQYLISEKGYDIVTKSVTKHGGTIVSWRLSGLWLKENEGKPLRSKTERGGWNQQVIGTIKNQTKTSLFDVMIYRIPQGWIDSTDITHASLLETVEHVREYFGVKVLVFMTLPVCNNYKTLEDLREMGEANKRIVTFAQEFNNRSAVLKSSEPFVTVLDFGYLVTEMARLNAKHIFTNSSATHSHEPFLVRSGKPPWTHPAALVCADTPLQDGNSSSCPGNQLSSDGMHVCMETFSGRLVGGVSCQIQCFVEKGDGEECPEKCNVKYMRTFSTPATEIIP